MTSTSANLTEALKQEIRGLVQEVLAHSHTSPAKQTIKEMSGRVTLACPYCGDSTKDDKKKRGNIFWDTLQYHCYNCGYHTDVNNFLKDHDLRLRNSEHSIQVIEYIKEHRVEVKQIETMQFGIFQKVNQLAIDPQDFMRYFQAKPIEPGDFAWFYLRGRLLHNKSDRFLFSNKDRRLWILNKTGDGKIIGCQSRQLREGAKSKYLTYDLGKLYEEMGMEMPETGDDLVAINKVSTLFGIMQADMMRPVTVFEGPLDAMFVNNSLALATAGRSTNEFDEIPTIRYMFDNDETGKKKMLEKLKRGSSVFMWSKFLQEMKLNIYSDSIKDMNDLIKKCFELKIDAHKHIDRYFTSSRLDALYVWHF